MRKPPSSSASTEPFVQRALFDELASAVRPPAKTLVAIATPAAAQTKAQRAFNRLIGQIRQQRELLAQWQQYQTRYHQRLASELEPLQDQVREARRALLKVLDELLCNARLEPKLTKSQRRKLRAWVPALSGMLLDEGPDAEIEAIHDRYSDVPHAEQQQAELAEAEAMFSHFLGEKTIAGHQAQSLDELMQHAARNMAAQAEAESADREARRQARAQRTARGRQAEAARQRKEEAAAQASQSVREVFRKLASTLHPDRETDAAERERKTALMQQANQAYERNDLLTLLTLQLQTEQIDDEHLAGLPDARLTHYNQVLREQLQALEQEVQACLQPFRVAIGAHFGQLTPVLVDSALSKDLAGLRSGLAMLVDDAAGLRDPARRRAVIDALEMPDAGDDEPNAFEMMLMMDALAVVAPTPGRRRRRR